METSFVVELSLTKKEMYDTLENFLQSGKAILRGQKATITLTNDGREKSNGDHREDT